MTDLNVKLILQAFDRMSPALAQAGRNVQAFAARVSGGSGFGLVSAASGNVARNVRGLGDAVGTTAQRFAVLGTAGGLLGGGVLALVKRSVIDVSSQFEDLGAVLKITEGSSAKAQQALDWVSKFATETPYEIGQVAEAFTRLRSYGLNPTNGLLQTLGDTAAATSKPLMQAVEAVGDAVNGQSDRLLEFGITAAKSGSQIAYSYVDAAGKQQRKVVDANNRAMIESTLRAIWSAKYGGAMKELSETWTGVTSNLSDAWARFGLEIGKAGFFDFIKGEAKGLLATFEQMRQDGTLKEWAKEISDDLITAFKEGKAALLDFVRVAKSIGADLLAVKEYFGSWTPILGAVAAVIAGPLIAAVVSLGTSLVTLGAAMLATPFGWMAAAAAGLVVGAIALYQNWDMVAAKLSAIWAGITAEWNKFTSALGDVGRALGIMSGPAKGPLAGIGGAAPASASAAPPTAFPAGANPRFTGSIDVQLGGAPAGSRVRQVKSSSGLDLGLALGPVGAGG